AIRAVGGGNANRTLIIQSVGGNPYNLKLLQPSDFAGPVVFSFHFYDPGRFTSYTTQLQQHREHPDKPEFPVPDSHNERLPGNWKNRIDEVLVVVRNWQEQHHARIYVGEFSASLLPD